MSQKATILILGKLPPPIIGPAIATNIILNSSLKEGFDLIHFDCGTNDTTNSYQNYERCIFMIKKN